MGRRFWSMVLAAGGLGPILTAFALAQEPRNVPALLAPTVPANLSFAPPAPPRAFLTLVQAPVQPPASTPGQSPSASAEELPERSAPAAATTAPPQVAAPTAAASASAPQAPSFGGGGQAEAAASASAAQQSVAQQASSGIATGGEATVRDTTDVGDLLSKSLGSVGVIVQRRSPIITDPRIRGLRQGQIITQSDGAYFVPVRPDLDTIVSKLNSTMIRSAVVVKGPFTVRYGPALSVIDVETLATPRYDKFEYHGSTSMSYKSNGAGWSGTQTVYGGGDDFGFRMSWDSLAGNDYRTGSGTDIPSSYNSQSFNFAFGYDLDKNNHLEFKALRLMQRNVEIPGTITDINNLVTDSYALRFTSEDQPFYDRFSFDAWFNETRFSGDNFRPGKRQQIPLLDNLLVTIQGGPTVPFRLFTETNGDANSWGGRAATTWGKDKDAQVTAGADFRYLSQAVNEFNTLFSPGLVDGGPQNFTIPRSRSINPGLFADLVLPMTERWTLRAGARGDLEQARIQQPPTQYQTTLADLQTSLGGALNEPRHYALYSAFLTSETKFTQQVTGSLQYGYGQRAPTLVELYTNQVFLGILQNGFSSFRGDPNLEKEQLHMMNLGLKGDFENFRASANGFCGLSPNYITFKQLANLPGTELRSFQFTNTEQALLAGSEVYAEIDVVEWLTPFTTLSYVYGQDQARHEALPNIPPLDTRVGFRVHDPAKTPKWAVEFTSRMVAAQTRIATSLLEQRTSGFTVFDLRAFWQVRENLLLTTGLENLGDRFYREHLDLRTGLGVFQPGLNYYFGVRWTY